MVWRDKDVSMLLIRGFGYFLMFLLRRVKIIMEKKN